MNIKKSITKFINFVRCCLLALYIRNTYITLIFVCFHNYNNRKYIHSQPQTPEYESLAYWLLCLEKKILNNFHSVELWVQYVTMWSYKKDTLVGSGKCNKFALYSVTQSKRDQHAEVSGIWTINSGYITTHEPQQTPPDRVHTPSENEQHVSIRMSC